MDATGNFFSGATTGNSCMTVEVSGVAYVTSNATIHQAYMTSWDRGYNVFGFWTMGPGWPYVFDIRLRIHSHLANKKPANFFIKINWIVYFIRK